MPKLTNLQKMTRASSQFKSGHKKEEQIKKRIENQEFKLHKLYSKNAKIADKFFKYSTKEFGVIKDIDKEPKDW